MNGDAPQYLAAHIQERLADQADELGIRVDVRGDSIYLRGEVASEGQRRVVEGIAREVVPGRHIRNELHVVSVHAPDGEETLS